MQQIRASVPLPVPSTVQIQQRISPERLNTQIEPNNSDIYSTQKIDSKQKRERPWSSR